MVNQTYESYRARHRSSAALHPLWHWGLELRNMHDCDCGVPEASYHFSWCSVTPIYAEVSSVIDIHRIWPLLAMDSLYPPYHLC